MSVNNNILFQSGGCNDDPLNYSCYCYGLVSNNDSKVFDVATRTFHCCGGMNLLATSNSPQPLGVRDPKQNLLLNIALTSDPACKWWYNGSGNNFPSDYLASNPAPTPGEQWYLPDADNLVNGLMPSVYGPSQGQIQVYQNQSYINEVIYLPSSTVGSDHSTTVQCPASTGGANIELYWMRYLNPNYRSNFYNVSMVCADINAIKSSTAFSQSNFALFTVPSCELGDTPGVYTCTQSVGEITNFADTYLGQTKLSSQNYGGGFPPFSTAAVGPTSYLWLVITLIVLIAIVVIIVVLAIYFNHRAEVKRENIMRSADLRSEVNTATYSLKGNITSVPAIVTSAQKI